MGSVASILEAVAIFLQPLYHGPANNSQLEQFRSMFLVPMLPDINAFETELLW